MDKREGAWRDFFEVAPGSFVVVDHDGVVLDASVALLCDLGKSRDVVVGRPFADALHAVDDGGALKDGSNLRCLAHASGGERWFGITARETGGLFYGVLVPREAPTARGPLAGLLSPGQQLAAVLEHAPIVIFAVDRNGVIALSRGHGLRALSLGQDEVTGKSLFDLYAEEPTVVASVRRALDGHAFSSEIASQGRRFEAHFAPLRDGSGEVQGAMGIAIDVTDHYRAEERFRLLIERMPDGVAVVREGRVVYANPTLVAELGRTRHEEVLDRKLSELLSSDDTSTLARVEAASSSAERLPPREGRFRTKSGEILTAEVALMPIGDGNAPATLLVARNVTERKAMQTRLILAERLVSLGTLAAGVAHEINNPLTYVSLNLGFMTRELAALGRELGAAPTGEPARSLDEQRLDLRARVERTSEALRVTKEGVERVATIVRDLRTFSRSEEDDRGPIDVQRVLESAISIAWNEIRHRARLAKEYGDTPPVVANEARLAQVFVHLLLNAAHALPEGDAARHEIRVVASTDERGRMVVEVRDTGAGIPLEIIDRIFDPFFTTKPVGVGTGLGLSVCHGIVSSLGGEISAHCPPSGGTVFRVSLPAYDAPASVPADRTSLAPPSPRSPRPRALIIDDEPFVVQALRRTLEIDADVVTVESGRDAIDLLLRDQRFDVILCDLMMPDIGGMDVYEAVRRARPGVEKNFVLMTGGAFTHRARDFVAAVPNRCLDKPIEPEEIRRLVMESRGKK